MAAITTGILSLLEPGDEVLASASLYGGTARFCATSSRASGSRAARAPLPTSRVARWRGERTRAIVLESPTNPMLEVVDLAAAWRRRPTAAASPSSWTTPSPLRWSSSR